MGTRILVVEDEDAIADFLVRGLREEGFLVERAADGADGWNCLESGGWDVVLLDWWLPKIDGLTLLKQFRKADQSTPILFLTAKDSVTDRVHGLDSGADDYLCKPFAFEELLARIRVLSRRRVQSPARSLEYADVVVDLVSQRVVRAGHRIDMTAREQALLIFFLRHPDEVLSKSRIYEHVWDEHYDGLSNTLEVHIMELRKKLEAHGSRLIHTLRNRGYLLATQHR